MQSCDPPHDSTNIPEGLGQHVARLIVDLEEAFDRAKSGSERDQYINALVGIASFAKAVGLSPAADRIKRLADRLEDLKHGRVHQLLKPAKKGTPGSVGDSFELWEHRMRVLVALKELEKAGMTEQAAARHIVKRFPEVSALVTRGKNIPATILRWRRDLYDEGHLRFFGDLLFNELYPFVDQETFSPDEWRSRAESMLRKVLAEALP